MEGRGIGSAYRCLEHWPRAPGTGPELTRSPGSRSRSPGPPRRRSDARDHAGGAGGVVAAHPRGRPAEAPPRALCGVCQYGRTGSTLVDVELHSGSGNCITMSNLRQKNPKASLPEGDGPAAAPAAHADASVSESFRQNLDAARKALERGFGRFRPAHHKEKTAAAAVPTTPAGDLVARLQEGLRKEREFILIPLLDRLDAFAGRLLAGKPLPAQPLEEGLALVERYRLQLHDAHLHLLEQTYSELPNDAPSRLAYQQLTSDYDHARVRWVTVRVMVSGYESKYAGYRGLL